MLGGSRALEFLASQVVSALNILVLWRRDSLLDSALPKMHAASADALVQLTLHPPMIPRKTLSGVGCCWLCAGVYLWCRLPGSDAVFSPVSWPAWQEEGGAHEFGPFSLSSGGSCLSGGKGRGSGKEIACRVVSPCKRWGGCLAPHWRRWQTNRSRVLVHGRSLGRISCSLLRLSFSPLSHPGIVSDVPGRLTSGSGIAARGRGDACQRILGNRPRSGTWLFQWSLPGGDGSGGWRPVINLSHLNEFVQLTPFKVETVASALLSVREGDFLASLDLKDAFQIPILLSSRKLLGSTSEGTVYHFQALCFGPSTAPRVFTKVFAAVSASARPRGFRLLGYLDAWWVLASSEREATHAVRSLLSLCRHPRMVLNEKKSDFLPSRPAQYLGMTIDTEAVKVFPSLARVE